MPGINLSEDLDSLICGDDVPLSLNSVDKPRVALELNLEFLRYIGAKPDEDMRRLRDYAFAQTSNNYPFSN